MVTSLKKANKLVQVQFQNNDTDLSMDSVILINPAIVMFQIKLKPIGIGGLSRNLGHKKFFNPFFGGGAANTLI